MSTFELVISHKGDIAPDLAVLASHKTANVTWEQLIEAVAISRHKENIQVDKCLGFKITKKGIILLFDR